VDKFTTFKWIIRIIKQLQAFVKESGDLLGNCPLLAFNDKINRNG
jgi:hypothetical protein